MTKAISFISLGLLLALILVLGGCQTPSLTQTAEPTALPTTAATLAINATPTPTTPFVMPLRSITPIPSRVPDPTPTFALEARVDLVDYIFIPEVITVTVGTPVIWTHRGLAEHNVTAVDQSWGSQMTHSNSWTHSFQQAGVYAYYCSQHPGGMRGRVIVVN